MDNTKKIIFILLIVISTTLAIDTINIKNAKYRTDDSPLDPECDCPVCRTYSESYLRHLFEAEEMLGMRLCVMHNLYFYNNLMEKIRESMDNGTFEEFYNKYVDLLDKRI